MVPLQCVSLYVPWGEETVWTSYYPHYMSMVSHQCVSSYVNWADKIIWISCPHTEWEWCLTCMCSGAPTEVTRLCKPLMIHITWFLSCVSSHLAIELTRLFYILVYHMGTVSLLSMFLCVQWGDSLVECFTTHMAGVVWCGVVWSLFGLTWLHRQCCILLVPETKKNTKFYNLVTKSSIQIELKARCSVLCTWTNSKLRYSIYHMYERSGNVFFPELY